MMFGINRCEVVKAALSATLVIPGVLAIAGNGGAWLFGAADCPRTTTRQATQIVWAIWALGRRCPLGREAAKLQLWRQLRTSTSMWDEAVGSSLQ
jgi:hypothetical protein